MQEPSQFRDAAIRVLLMPKDTNENGTIFGGVILSHIDLAGAVEARRHMQGRFVTVAMREVVFKEPVFVGDLVSFYTQVIKKGRTSLTIEIRVEAQRRHGARDDVVVTTAEAVFVSVDDQGKPTPIQPW